MPTFQMQPEQASEFAWHYDLLFFFELAVCVFFFVLVVALVAGFAVKYRRGSRANRSRPVDHNEPLEIGTIAILLVLSLVAFVWATKLYADVYAPPKNALEIFVIGKQWMWHLQHPNGVRENNELHIPVGRPIKLTMISQDVIHSFYVPTFRIKKDVIPGTYTTVWFKPTKAGKYRLFCAEYCGTQHSEMTGYVYVMDPAEYAEWLSSGGRRSKPVRESMEQAGARLFNDELGCVQCHGFAPARAPSVVGLYGRTEKLDDGTRAKVDSAYLRESMLMPDAKVVDGYQPIMPSYRGVLSEDQVLQITAYIKSLQAPPQAVPATGAGTAAATGTSNERTGR